VPYFTVTIEVDGSKVKSIQWDEGCYTCKSEAWCVRISPRLPHYCLRRQDRRELIALSLGLPASAHATCSASLTEPLLCLVLTAWRAVSAACRCSAKGWWASTAP
jgi:hypothetical protein